MHEESEGNMTRKKESMRQSYTQKVETKCGTMKIIFDFVERDGMELLDGISILMGKAKVCANTQALGYTALLNLQIDHGLPLTEIAGALEGLNECSGLKDGLSCPAAIAKALRNFIE